MTTSEEETDGTKGLKVGHAVLVTWGNEKPWVGDITKMTPDMNNGWNVRVQNDAGEHEWYGIECVEMAEPEDG